MSVFGDEQARALPPMSPVDGKSSSGEDMARKVASDAVAKAAPATTPATPFPGLLLCLPSFACTTLRQLGISLSPFRQLPNSHAVLELCLEMNLI